VLPFFFHKEYIVKDTHQLHQNCFCESICAFPDGRAVRHLFCLTWHGSLTRPISYLMSLHSQLKMFSARSSDCVKRPGSINLTQDVSIYTNGRSVKRSYCPWREEDTECRRGSH